MPSVVLNALKKVLLARVELRLVTTLVLLSLAALVFGAFMKDGAERSTPRGGALGRVAFGIGSMPQNFYRRFFGVSELPLPDGLSGEQRFHGGGGLISPSVIPPREAGYLVVARRIPFPEKDAAEPPERSSSLPTVVEIIDLNQRKVVHSWKPISGDRLERFNVLSDGSLLVGGTSGGRGSPTIRMDACSNVVWEQQLQAHHSFERDADGAFWSPWRVDPSTIPHTNPDFVEDGFVRFSPDGEVLSRITLWGALRRAGHGHLLYGRAAHSQGDPFHMNDVEPVLQDGPFWRRGDLFVSLRNSSVVLLYRPATDEVLWLQAGPWLHQHDVDVVSDSEISVYSNNTVFDDDPWVLGANEVYVHDFATGETRSPWREAMRRHDVRTWRQGGSTLFADGSVMLEESRYGRILTLSPDGGRVWSYVNRASDGMLYVIEASRWLDAEYGAEVARSIASRGCGAEMD